MNDRLCVAFLQWALPRMGMRWEGFRKVRRQVCRRIRDRIAELGLDGPEAYRERLDSDRDEWDRLAVLCRVTISRFARDRGVWGFLEREVLPALARRAREVRAWSAGCASGEEPYTLVLRWHLRVASGFPGTRLLVLASDVDPALLERARRALYPKGSLRELDPELREHGFNRKGEEYRLRARFRHPVELALQDIRREMPRGPFDLILCRNLAFTYFGEDEQARILTGLLRRLKPGGALVLGAHERPPTGDWPLERWSPAGPVHRKREDEWTR